MRGERGLGVVGGADSVKYWSPRPSPSGQSQKGHPKGQPRAGAGPRALESAGSWGHGQLCCVQYSADSGYARGPCPLP